MRMWPPVARSIVARAAGALTGGVQVTTGVMLHLLLRAAAASEQAVLPARGQDDLGGGSSSCTGCCAYYQPLTGADVQAPKRWCSEGGYFTFTSPNNRNETAELFWRCGGDPSAFTIFLGHGWPTSSYDFQHLAALLEPHLYVCSIDYVGAGFSDKPKSPWRYHIDDHAQAVHDFLVWKNLTQLAYYTHDEGSTVGLRLLQRMQDATAKGQPPAYHLVHHFLTDGSIYLPLAHLSKGQLDLLSNVTGPALQKVMFASVLAHNMGHNDFHPGLTAAQITALASVMAYQNGSHIMHETIQYLLLAYYKLFAYRR